MATSQQIAVREAHKWVCQGVGTPQVHLHHRAMRGTRDAPNSHGNVRFRASGPITDETTLYETDVLVWWVNMAFLRGEQRQEQESIGIIDTDLMQSQIPAIDDSGAFVDLQPLDVIVDPQGNIWVVENPTLDHSQTFWNFMSQRER